MPSTPCRSSMANRTVLSSRNGMNRRRVSHAAWGKAFPVRSWAT